MARAGGKRSISVAELRAECSTLERAVIGGTPADAAALGPYRPGGRENPGRDARAWLSYYRYLHRRHAAGDAGSGRAVPAHAAADAMVLDALRAEPIAVRRLDAAADEPPLYVYPKSLDASLWLEAHDRWMRFELRQYALLKARLDERPSAQLAELLHPMLDVISYDYQLFAWVVTTPGPEMPFGSTEDRPEPPESIRTLAEWDVIRLVQAYQQHLHRLAGLSALLDADREDGGDGTRPSWSGFLVGLAGPGGDTEHLAKHRALLALLAAARLDANAKAPKKSEAA